MKKISFIGAVLNEATQSGMEDTKAITLKRGLRKHKNLKMPKVHDQYVLAKAVEAMENKVKNVDYTFGTSGSFRGEKEITSPSRKSVTMGHELGHAIDRRAKGEKFLGDRGTFGIGGKPKTQLKSELSASKHILDKLPKHIQRKQGPELAYAYDTYVTSAKRNPKGDMFIFRYPEGEAPKAELQEKLKKHFRFPTEPVEKYTHEHKLSKKMRRARGIDPYTRLDKFVDNQNFSNKHKYLKHLGQEQELNNRKLMFNIKELGSKDSKLMKSEALKYIKDTRKAFGPSVARGVIDQIREIRDTTKKLKPLKTSFGLKDAFKTLLKFK